MIGRIRVVSFVASLAVVVLALPAVANGQEESAVEGKLRKALLERLGGTLGEADGVPGKLLRAGRARTKADRELARKIKKATVTVDAKDLPLQAALGLICGAAEIPVSVSDGVVETAATAYTSFNLEDVSFSEAMKVLRKSNTYLTWRIHAGTLHFMTNDERDEEREARRDLLESLIEEIAGEDARFLGDRYLLLYVGEVEESAETRRIRETLALKKITVNFERTPFDTVVSFLQDITGINMVRSPGVDELGEITVSLAIKDIGLKSFLNLLVDSTGPGIEWTIKNDVVNFRTEDEAESAKDENRSFVLIDISDLLYVPQDFPAPKLGLEGLKRDY